MPSLAPPFSTGDDIMIVDDNPANLRLLEEMLERESYEVRSFPLGRLALAAAAKHPPDLILLDVNMPEMNGYEVCERLKASETLANIPVIFLSALDTMEDKVKAFHSGAADYISKPFRLEEVQARVKTHLSIHSLQRALKLQNEHLERGVAARTLELAQANERLTILDNSKSDFLNLISHEFRTPLNGLLGVGDLLLDEMTPHPGNEELRGIFQRSRRRILTILDDALLLTQIDSSRDWFKSGPVCLSSVLERAIAASAEFAESRRVKVLPPSANLGRVVGDEALMVKAIKALIETAVKFSRAGDAVHFSDEAKSDACSIFLESTGGTIPPAALPTFFDLFAICEAITPGGDLGLGPPVAHRILSLFGGSVGVANRLSSGIRFTVSLKKAEL